MTQVRGTRITIETERILVVAQQHATRGWCERCGLEVEFLTSDQLRPYVKAVQLGKQSSERLHLGQARAGLVICVKSLLSFLRAASGRRT